MIKREIFIFLIVGALTVLVDFSTYFILLSLNIWSIAVCKAIGFITGTLFAYLANKTWTFGHTQPARGSVLRFGLLY
ncbi:MAG TPA: GtrA family protein, partial [Gammaproteobacteria bacterium]|nr:GtrA family protein [Gammaproteobacteria bacterium]